MPSDQSLDVTVAVHQPRWHEMLPNATIFCDQLIRHALTPHRNRWQQKSSKGNIPMEVACILTDDREIHDLNLRFRGKDSATNVLSFAADPAGPFEDGQPHVLGDVILSLDTLEREAKQQGKALQDHAAHMIVHGVLHLIGFDHIQDASAGEMESQEIILLSAIGIANPYEVVPKLENG